MTDTNASNSLEGLDAKTAGSIARGLNQTAHRLTDLVAIFGGSDALSDRNNPTPGGNQAGVLGQMVSELIAALDRNTRSSDRLSILLEDTIRRAEADEPYGTVPAGAGVEIFPGVDHRLFELAMQKLGKTQSSIFLDNMKKYIRFIPGKTSMVEEDLLAQTGDKLAALRALIAALIVEGLTYYLQFESQDGRLQGQLTDLQAGEAERYAHDIRRRAEEEYPVTLSNEALEAAARHAIESFNS